LRARARACVYVSVFIIATYLKSYQKDEKNRLEKMKMTMAAFSRESSAATVVKFMNLIGLRS